MESILLCLHAVTRGVMFRDVSLSDSCENDNFSALKKYLQSGCQCSKINRLERFLWSKQL